MSVTAAQVASLLEDILYETPADAAVTAAYWLGLQSEDSTVPTFAPIVAASPEMQIPEQVVRFYEAVLGRDPDFAELSYYTAIAEAGTDPAHLRQGIAATSPAAWTQIAADFAASPEFTAEIAGQDVVGVLYQNFFNRTPSAAELAYYHGQIAAGAGNAQLIQEFLNAPEYQNGAGSAGRLQSLLRDYGESLVEGNTSTKVLIFDAPTAQHWPTAGPYYAVAPALGAAWIGETLILADSARLTVDAETVFGASVTTATSAILALEQGIGAHHVAWGVYDGNTFFVESQTGTPGAADTTVLGVIGVHSVYSPGPATLVFSS